MRSRLAVLAALMVTLATASASVPVATAAEPSVLLPASAKLVTTRKLDVDGDGHADTVRVYRVTSTRYQVKVTTFKKRTASRTVSSTIAQDWGLNTPWVGAARIDGVKGYEVWFATSGGDGVGETVLTWRSGKLASEKAPASPWGEGWYEGGPGDGSPGHGYRFFASKGKRFVDTYGLETVDFNEPQRYAGTVVRSQWKSGAWRKVKTYKVNLTYAQFKAKLQDHSKWVK